MFGVLQDTIVDSIKLIPFLFITYLIMELIEHSAGEKTEKLIKKSGKFGPLLGTNKKVLLPIEYDQIKNVYSDNTYVAKKDGAWKIINNNNSIDMKYDDVISIDNENIIVKEDNKYGIISQTGQEEIKPQYDELKNIYQNYYIAKKDNLYGVINTNNEVKIDFTYKKLVYIKSADIIEGESDKVETDLFDKNFSLKLSGIVSEINVDKGYMKVRVNSDYKYYNFKFEEKSKSRATPEQKIKCTLFSQCPAILNIRKIKSKYSTHTTPKPKSPTSSAMPDKTKSVCTSLKKPSLKMPSPKPSPKNPPCAMALSECEIW